MKPLPTFPLEGGCSCGQVRYRLDAPPACVYVCHCTDCQTLSASAFSINGPIRPEALTITRGALRTWVRTAESGNQIPTHVCPHCGVRIYTEPAGNPSSWTLRLGTLDDTSWIWPAAAIFMQSKQPWLTMPEGTLLYEGAAPDFRPIVAHYQTMLAGA
jgi:hypothetical protein